MGPGTAVSDHIGHQSIPCPDARGGAVKALRLIYGNFTGNPAFTTQTCWAFPVRTHLKPICSGFTSMENVVEND